MRVQGTRTFRFEPNNPNAIIVYGAHKAIVDEATWDAVHNRPKTPRTAVPRMLSGLLWVNGEPFGGDNTRGRAFYRGPRGKRGGPWLDSLEADTRVWDALVKLATEPAFVQRLLEEAQTPTQRVIAEAEVAHLRDQFRKLNARHDRFIEMRADGELSKERFLAKSDEVKKAIAEVERQLNEEKAKLQALDGTHAQRLVSVIRTLIGGRTKLTVEQKRGILRSIVRRIEITAVKLKWDYRRNDRGQVLPGSVNTWETKNIKLVLCLPTSDDQVATVEQIPHSTTKSKRQDSTYAIVHMNG